MTIAIERIRAQKEYHIESIKRKQALNDPKQDRDSIIRLNARALELEMVAQNLEQIRDEVEKPLLTEVRQSGADSCLKAIELMLSEMGESNKYGEVHFLGMEIDYEHEQWFKNTFEQ